MKDRTLATTVRCDARDAAMALLLFNSQGIHIGSMSDLFRESVRLLAEMAVHQGLTPNIVQTIEAVDVLRKQGIIDLLDAGRPNFATLVRRLSNEDKQELSTQGPSPEDLRKSIEEAMQRASGEKRVLADEVPKHIVADPEDE